MLKSEIKEIKSNTPKDEFMAYTISKIAKVDFLHFTMVLWHIILDILTVI